MAGNIQADTSGNILVEFDYDSIIVVDPNKTIDDFGNIKDRLVDHENLVMYANLEADVLPRTKLAVGISPQDSGFETISVAKINFLKPTKNSYLGTGYYDQLTGENTTQGKGVNQPSEIIDTNSNGVDAYVRNSVVDEKDIIDTGLLGITSINIQTNSSFIPQVDILLEDIQGKGLFELGDNSPYSAFFNLPYPQFYLTLKGYYGQAVRYQLNLEKFHASFNGFSGNYIVRLTFKGYKFNILNEISMGHLLAAPHMYSQRFDITQTVEGPQQSNKAAESQASTQAEKGANNLGSNQAVVTQIVAEKGYQKIVEVYSEYKAKGLIEPNFPELTLVQLMTKLEKFEDNIMQSFDKVEVASLTNVRNYKGDLTKYFSAVRGSNTSWFITNLDPKPFVLKSGAKLYVFKKISREQKNTAIEQLKKIITESNSALAENATLGVRGLTPIPNPIKYDMLTVTPPQSTDINWRETTRLQTGIVNPTLQDEVRVQSSVSSLFIPNEAELTDSTGAIVGAALNILNSKVNPVPQEWFVFEGDGRFDSQIALLESQANKKLADYESEITALLLRKIEDTATGIGFKPTVRNMIAVIMASAEGFIRLMDEVHTNAWAVKYDPVRYNAILENPSSAQSSETVDLVVRDKSNLMNENQMDSTAVNSQIPVYPWPQFFVETNEDGEPKFQLKYIADPTVVDLTQGYLFDKWPEVEFVEEYMKGLTQKFQNPNAPPPLDNERDTNVININAIEYPSIGLAYSNKEEVKFFYEIWERQFITSHYSGLIRANLNQVDELIKLNIETEVNNIVTKIGVSSPYLSLKLKNFNLNATNYPEFLRTISNSGTGRAYQDYIRDFFVTPYLRGITENSFAILSTLDLGKIPQVSTKSEALRSLIVNDSNTPLIVDTLPYTNPTWCLNNLNQGNTAFSNQVYNTNKSLTIFEPRKIIANFTDVYNYTFNRPVTNFSYLVNQNPTSEVIAGLNFFYISRFPDKFIPTEGYVNGTYPTNNSALTSLGSNIFRTTTSMLNTPYFVNAIQNGVYNSRISGNTYPYVQAAYLFLNSLPLATLREKYKSYENNVTTDLDYISSALKKFGAIHKLPYAWILKYGSIWHRYKKYKESNVDILQSAWKNFNYEENFYPPTSSITETYTFKYSNVDKNITLQTETTTDVNMQVGFYPKLINDFNVFYNGYDLYQNYTDKEIQQSVNAGMKLYNFSDSNIINTKQGDKNLRLSTWSVVLPNTTPELPIDCNPNDNTKGSDYFVVPSFGTSLNQSVNACIQNVTTTPTTKVDLSNNPSVYNGSVRCLWSAPNYGYFDGNQLAFPQPDSYLNFITTGSTSQTPFHFLTQDNYTKIEEVFSVFEKKILDSFELEFLNFSKSINNATGGVQNVTFGQSPVDMNANFRNFQSLFKSLMTVPVQVQGETDEQYFTNTISNQYSLFQNGIKSFMEYDVIFKYGNPSNYQRRIFDSYLSHNNVDEVVDPIIFNPYVSNSLPQLGSDLTLGQSQANNREAWTALETEVGFSTIPNVRYSSFGSYITDFFIDNNIEFTSQNVTLLAPIIKMFATQKLNNPSITASQFQNQLSQYLQRETSLQNNFLNGVLTGVRANLPDQQQLPERVINSVITGEQSKVENYEVFKALNDKWIAGGDYTTKTLFEDFLFLDRASRNIGDKILIDIFALKKVFNSESLNQAMSVFTFVSGILIRNNFTVMPLPSYVNFYNVQEIDGTEITKPEGSLEFANNLWGTFLNVDYRKSSSKFVCFFVGKPSQYPNLPKKNSKYRSDAFEMRRASGNPLLSQLPFTQRDRALSNRCVGFNVDVGTRNQNIFYSLNVSQDNGNATSESINIQIDMSNQATGRAVATQNTGLYNYYKNRSYKATVTSLGNALLQPTMYFNLRHVPMFEGSYMITNVTHSIQPGSFQTTFDGVRQGFFDLPTIDSLLQSINQNLVTKLEEILKINKDQVKDSATTNNVKSTEVVQAADNTLDTTNSCSSKITAGVYRNAIPGYVPEVGTFTAITPTEFATALKRILPNEPDLRTLIYSISYIRTFQESSNTKQGTFNGWNNNFGTLSLSVDWQGQVQLFPRVYSCVNIKTNPSTSSSQPIIHFESLDNYINFMAGRLRGRVNQILEPNMGLAKYYVCHWPVDNISEQYFDNNINEFNQTIETFKKALASAKSVDLLDVDKLLEYKKPLDDDASNDKTPGVTPTPTVIPPNEGQTCPPPVVTTFSPSAGFTGTIVQVNGRNFESVKSIKVIDKVVELKDITVLNRETLRFSLPEIQIPLGQQVATGRITVTTEYGTSGSTANFTFNPKLKDVTTSSPGSYSNTTSQQQSSVQQQDLAGANLNPQNTGVYPVEVTNQTKNPISGDEELVVKVKPDVGVWRINSQPTISYVVYTVSVGANNSIVKQERKSTKTPVSIVGFVSEDQQTFTCTRQKLIEEEFKDVLELYKNFDLRIETDITLLIYPEDTTKNLKEVPSSQKFNINVPPTMTEGLGRLTLVSDTNSGGLPNLNGDSYYNIIKPNGGYYTYLFTPITDITKLEIEVFRVPELDKLTTTITNGPNTKYTNLIQLSALGTFQLGVRYKQNNKLGSTFVATSEKFIL